MDINWSVSQRIIKAEKLETGKTYYFTKESCPVFAYDMPIPIVNDLGDIIGEGVVIQSENNTETGLIKIISLKNQND